MEEIQEPALNNNPAIVQHIQQHVNGAAAQSREIKRQTIIEQLRLSGTVKPATLINFNPFPLPKDFGLRHYTVPAANDKNVPDDMKFRIKFNGKEYRGTYLTVREPIVYPRITDVKADDEELIGEYEFKVCKPIEQIFAMHQHATVGAPDSLQMYGVVMFEGDKHVLGKRKKDDDLIVQVPTYKVLKDRTHEYFTVAKDFDDMVAEALKLQKATCEAQIQLAQTYFDDPDQRRNITQVHRIWAQYAIEMGWKERPPAWLTSIDDPTDTCVGCGSAKQRAEAFFCHKCNRPYDPFAAFMAGENIPDVYLTTLPDTQFAEVKKELARRKKRLADLQS